MGIFIKLKQRFCKHNYKKHYSTTEKGYVFRCTKCDKVMHFQPETTFLIAGRSIT